MAKTTVPSAMPSPAAKNAARKPNFCRRTSATTGARNAPTLMPM